jgi:hypothetical protein
MKPLASIFQSAVLPVALAVACPLPAVADTVTFTPAKDNTLIQDPTGAYSSALSAYFFAGRVGANGGGSFRRGLVRFDLSSIPVGSTISSVSLRLYCSAAGVNAQHPVALHRLLASWGEGTSLAFGGGGAASTPGDATWINRFHPGQPWTTAGGDFAATASATRNVGGQGFYTWTSTAGLVADIQQWVNEPTTNHGWLFKGNEATQQSVKRFDSREAGASTRPQLTVVFTPPPPPNPADLNGDGVVNAADLATLHASWGTPGPGDLDGDGTVGSSDLTILLAAWTA